VSAEIDPVALEQIFTFWAPLSPRTIFRDIFEVPPGHYLSVAPGNIKKQSYWNLTFGGTPAELSNHSTRRSADDYLEELSALLVDAVRLRLRADVPVGAYLSGGLDSSIIASTIRSFTSNRLDTFSIAFED